MVSQPAQISRVGIAEAAAPLRLRPEAEKRVARLFEGRDDPAAVIRLLRADRALADYDTLSLKSVAPYTGDRVSVPGKPLASIALEVPAKYYGWPSDSTLTSSSSK